MTWPADLGTRRAARGRVAWQLALVVLFGLIVAVTASTVDGFGGDASVLGMQLDFAELVILAAAVALVMVAGEIDLSAAAVVGLCAALIGRLLDAGIPLWLVIPIAVVTGAAAGAVNGWLVGALRLPSFAVTLGTLAAYLSLAGVLLSGRAAEVPSDVRRATTQTIGPVLVSYAAIGAIVFVAALGVGLRRTGAALTLRTIGTDRPGAFASGLRVRRAIWWLYAGSGTVAGLAAALVTLRPATHAPPGALGLTLSVFTAVLLAGVAVRGGRGSLFGVVVAAAVMAVGRAALAGAGVPADVVDLCTGGLLLAAVFLPALVESEDRPRYGGAIDPDTEPPPEPRPTRRERKLAKTHKEQFYL